MKSIDDCKPDWRSKAVVPTWVKPDKASKFIDLVCDLAPEFSERWDYNPTPDKQQIRTRKTLIEQDILGDLNFLQQEWGIKENFIRGLMVEIHRFLPEEWRIPSFNTWKKEVHPEYFAMLIKYLEARFSDRWVKIQEPATQARIKAKKTVAKATKKLNPENFKRLAFVLCAAINVLRLPVTIDGDMVKRLLRNNKDRTPVIWRERIKLLGRRLSYQGKSGDFGLIEHFLAESGNARSTIGKAKPKSIQENPQERAFIGLACIFLIKRTVEDFRRSKLALGEKFAPEVWMDKYLGGTTFRRDTP